MEEQGERKGEDTDREGERVGTVGGGRDTTRLGRRRRRGQQDTEGEGEGGEVGSRGRREERRESGEGVGEGEGESGSSRWGISLELPPFIPFKAAPRSPPHQPHPCLPHQPLLACLPASPLLAPAFPCLIPACLPFPASFLSTSS